MKVIHSGLSEEMTRKVGHLPLGTPALLYSWVDSPDEGAEHLLVQEGYTRALYYLRLERGLQEAPPVPLWPEGIMVRPFQLGRDDRVVFDAIEDAFQDEVGNEPGDFEQWL